MATDMTVSTEIYRQLGGSKFKVMTGSYNLVGDTYSLSMHLQANLMKAKYLKIELTPMDTYKLTFSTMKKTLDKEMTEAAKNASGSVRGMKFYNEEHVILEVIEGVYNDMLQDIFTQKTGLYCRFGQTIG